MGGVHQDWIPLGEIQWKICPPEGGDEEWRDAPLRHARCSVLNDPSASTTDSVFDSFCEGNPRPRH
ncbi:hypothetical protein CYJ10_11180 [Cupriavidus pauculus]|uniref:Uncharacterized protein n=1 Tax=Cupriavidus pauculus TaxID=82633 RepID=A0A2N5CDE4_9BURK|nr:hypothetical protein CYJ10_11180 [Cupriavidus pauculus]